MSQELLLQIHQAEEQAEQIHQKAINEAREIIKAVEEATAIDARQAAKDIREGAQRLIDEARIGTEDEIKSLEVRRSAEREAMKEMAMRRVDEAAKTLFERIVENGHR